MIAGIGIDLTEMKRVEELVANHLQFPARILTEVELTQYQALTGRRQLEYLAGRYATKEAFSKALGTGIGSQFSFQDLAVLDDENGKPVAQTAVFDGNIHLSITHTNEYALAQVTLERESL